MRLDERYASMTLKQTLPGLFAVGGASLLCACVSLEGREASAVVVSHYTPSPIIVGTSSAGVFRPADGCIIFTHGAASRWQTAALFPPGTRVAGDQRSLLLPNGQAIRFGTEVTVAYQAPPSGLDDELCGLRPIQVLHLQERQV